MPTCVGITWRDWEKNSKCHCGLPRCPPSICALLGDCPLIEAGDIVAALEYAARQSDHPVLRVACCGSLRSKDAWWLWRRVAGHGRSERRIDQSPPLHMAWGRFQIGGRVKIFFSWQADTPTKSGRNLVERALERALAAVASDAEIDEPVRDAQIDKDTKGEPGSPPIVDTIFRKIDSAVVFVADLTFVGTRLDKRLTPNPNVLIEYGWALKSLSNSRIVSVMNVAHGRPTDSNMPFNLRHLRHPIQYDCPDDADEDTRKKARDQKLFVRFLALCPRAQEFYHQLQQRRINPNHHVQKIMALAEIYGSDAVVRAIEDAFTYQAFSCEYIVNILQHRQNPASEPGALHLTRQQDLLELDLPAPDLSLYGSKPNQETTL